MGLLILEQVEALPGTQLLDYLGLSPSPRETAAGELSQTAIGTAR